MTTTDSIDAIGRSIVRAMVGSAPSGSGAEARDPAIETLRGAAVLLLVSAHVIGLNRQTGMRVPDASWLRYFTDSFALVRMPLFTVISGYVYDVRPVVPGTIAAFLRGKARRLLLPMLTVATLQYLAKSSVPGVHHPVSLAGIAAIYVFPFDHFWFLQALALVFVVIALLEGRGLLRAFRGWLACGAVAVLVAFFMPRGTTLFSYPSALYLLPFFMLGLGMHRFVASLERPADHPSGADRARDLVRGSSGVLVRPLADRTRKDTCRGLRGWPRRLLCAGAISTTSAMARPARDVLLSDLPLSRLRSLRRTDRARTRGRVAAGSHADRGDRVRRDLADRRRPTVAQEPLDPAAGPRVAPDRPGRSFERSTRARNVAKTLRRRSALSIASSCSIR